MFNISATVVRKNQEANMSFELIFMLTPTLRFKEVSLETLRKK